MSLTGSIWKDIQHYIKYGDIGVRFILIQSIIYLAFALIKLTLLLSGKEKIFYEITYQFSAPSNLQMLMYKPWTLGTYMICHYELLHVLFNMITLYYASQIYNLYMREKHFISLYAFSGLIGYITFYLILNFSPALNQELKYIVGASASIFGILFAAVAINPDYEVHLFGAFRIRLIYLSLILLFAGLLSSPLDNTGGKFSHLGGALGGYLYMKILQSGFSPFSNLKKLFFPSKLKVTHRKVLKAGNPENYDDRNGEPSVYSEQEKIDYLLDKINRSGYESLSEEEKSFLRQFSNK